jgi:hypothetical protein
MMFVAVFFGLLTRLDQKSNGSEVQKRQQQTSEKFDMTNDRENFLVFIKKVFFMFGVPLPCR